MKTVSISSIDQTIDFASALDTAVVAARTHVAEPVIVAWKDDSAGQSAPEISGGKGERWQDHGESSGGALELTVSSDYHFIFTDASAFDKPDINLTSLTGRYGGYVLCINEACTGEDRSEFDARYGGGLDDG
jgi:hypothetical protein